MNKVEILAGLYELNEAEQKAKSDKAKFKNLILDALNEPFNSGLFFELSKALIKADEELNTIKAQKEKLNNLLKDLK